MARENLRTRFARLALAVMIGGSTYALGGCDPAVRQTLVTGLETTTQGLSATLISAFFISLDDDEDTGASLTTT